MLFLTSGGSNLLRLQGALISDDERKRVTDFLRSQADPVYIEEITKDDPDDESAGVSEDEKDELYETALGIIAETGTGIHLHDTEKAQDRIQPRGQDR